MMEGVSQAGGSLDQPFASATVEPDLGELGRTDRRESGTLGVHHALLVYTAPRRLFARVEDTGAYGWALVTLLVLLVLLGYAEVQTGLIDRTVAQQTEAQLANIETTQADLIDRIELRDRMEDARKQGEFNSLIARLGVIVFKPTATLASFLLIASVLYALVALTGRKPEYHTLMSICVYSGFIVLVGYIVRLAMVMHYRTTEVDTSLKMLAPPGASSPLAAIDPFRIWFWILVAIGLIVTRQLSRRMAIASCTVMALITIGVKMALVYQANS
ncbi:MAG: YIP1 family protein [Phycisphaerae bacterium]